MKYVPVYLDKYGWNVDVLLDVAHKDRAEVLKWLDSLGAYSEEASRFGRMDKGVLGMTYSNMLSRESLVVVGRSKDASEVMNTAAHENMHVAMHIAEAFDLDPFSEPPCYVAGKLMGEETDTLLILLR